MESPHQDLKAILSFQSMAGVVQVTLPIFLTIVGTGMCVRAVTQMESLMSTVDGTTTEIRLQDKPTTRSPRLQQQIQEQMETIL